MKAATEVNSIPAMGLSIVGGNKREEREMKVTKRLVNAALAEAGFEGVTLERGSGYWYFWGGESIGWYSASVAVYRLGSFTVEEWVNEAKALRDDWHNK